MDLRNKAEDQLIGCNQKKNIASLTKNDESIVFYVLVPVYKVEKYIDECIQSVLNQNYSNWRMILVDDGSPDRSGEICDKYADNDERIHVIHKQNGGLISARRAAIDYVLDRNDEGYLLFLDSDDFFQKDAFYLLAEAIRKTQSDLLIFNLLKFEVGDDLDPTDNSKAKITTIGDKRLLYKKVFSNESCNSLCRKAVSLSLVDKIDFSPFYHISHGEDLLQSIPLYRNAKKVCFYEASLYRYRMNPSSITHSISYSTYKPDSTLRKMVWDFLKEENVWTEDDFVEYMESCKRRLKGELRIISSFKAKRKDKKRIFEEMHADGYYQIVLSYAKLKDKMLRAFAKKRYWLVLLICDYYKMGSRVKRLLRRNK